MKKFSLRKKCVLGVACVLAVSSICYAAVVVTSTTSTSKIEAAQTDFGKLKDIEKELGYKAVVPESFSNGYKFESMQVGETQIGDNNDTATNKFKQLLVTYTKEGCEDLSLMVVRDPNGDEKEQAEPKATQTIKDVAFNYYLATYKVVPKDYKLTEEDKANEQKGDYVISYGSQEVKVSKVSHINWKLDDTAYTLMGSNISLSSDELIKMGSEFIK